MRIELGAMVIALSLLILPASGAADSPRPDTDFQRDEEHWRSDRLARLTSESGWLSLVGLHWLQEGSNRFGSGPGNEIVLPEGTSPALAGTLTLEKGTVRLHAGAEAGVTLDGAPVVDRVLLADSAPEPDVLRLGRLSLFVIQRGDRYALRVKDPKSPARAAFHGLDYFPPDPRYRIVARFTPYDPPREITVPTILGTAEKLTAPGRVTFTLDGREHALEPVLEEPDAKELFFIFRDETSGKETYPAGRYLYSDLPRDGQVVLDFNHAYNPPCAFTSYATCPFPPKQNILPARIEAGEKAYGHH